MVGPYGTHLGATATHARLTKTLLWRLSEGAYLVSNAAEPIGGGWFEAVYHEPVAPLAAREAQWQRLRANSGALVHVFNQIPNPRAYLYRL